MQAAPEARSQSRRETSAEATRKAITRSALELVRRLGWRGATIEKIAAHAGVAKGTFFVHYPTKEALIETLVTIQTQAALRARDRLREGGGSPLDRLRETVLTLGRHAGASIQLSRAVLVSTLQSDEVAASVDAMFAGVHDEMVADAREALRLGLIADVDPEAFAGLLMASYLGAALHCTTSPRAKPFDEVLEPLVDATLASFAKNAVNKNGTRRKR
jgi:AcrR family transcriptional regulator